MSKTSTEIRLESELENQKYLLGLLQKEKNSLPPETLDLRLEANIISSKEQIARIKEVLAEL